MALGDQERLRNVTNLRQTTQLVRQHQSPAIRMVRLRRQRGDELVRYDGGAQDSAVGVEQHGGQQVEGSFGQTPYRTELPRGRRFGQAPTLIW